MRSLNSGNRWVVRSGLVMAATLGLLSANTVSSAATGSTAEARSPVQMYGKVRVCGTQLCDESGKPVQLKGMSTHGTQWFAHCLTDGAMDVMAYDWKASVVRVATYAHQGGYETDPKKFTDLVSQLIERASARGMYVIVDWHMMNPGDPNLDLEKAKTFFTEIAQRYRGRNNVIYELANEPHGVSWSAVKSYSEKLIPVIRSHDPDSVIIVPTSGWSTFGASEGGNEREVVDNPVNATNIMYSFHFYSRVAREGYMEILDRASSKLPIFVTEWGTASWTGHDTDFPMSQKWVDLMAKKKIGWTNWSLSDNDRQLSVFKQGTCSAGTFSGAEALTPTGAWVRERIRS
ncbi:glycoside hydrolase family 5 protein [Streptomyces sp. NPDC005408]|uniref:glycoside hydrolase family 5 protein n=1 Tax=Streptomyces sp. NPDC005408 TaxID=3155341 RepID=UPI0033BCBDAC